MSYGELKIELISFSTDMYALTGKLNLVFMLILMALHLLTITFRIILK
jgi:hypothetical protein